MVLYFVQIFSATCIYFIPLIPAVLGIYLIVRLSADLLFRG